MANPIVAFARSRLLESLLAGLHRRDVRRARAAAPVARPDPWVDPADRATVRSLELGMPEHKVARPAPPVPEPDPPAVTPDHGFPGGFTHQYFSAACAHELHDDCDLRCGHCHVACRCACHLPTSGKS